MSGETKLSRRPFYRDAVVTMDAARFGIVRSAHAQTSTPTPIRAGHTSFGVLKHINAGLVIISYAEAGYACIETHRREPIISRWLPSWWEAPGVLRLYLTDPRN